MKYCFGVDIGGTTVKIGLFGEDGKLLDKWEIPTCTKEEGKAILPDVAEAVLSKIAERKLNKSDILGIGVGVPSPVTQDGVIKINANLGWKYKEVKRELDELTGLDSQIANDANVAALGEMWKGGGSGHKNMSMVTLGTGVGGGIIINGRMLIGTHGAGGEIGHMCVNPDESDICGCGRRGCLEQYASATGIVKLAKRKLAGETYATMLEKETVTAKAVFDAVKAGDAVAQEVTETFGRYMGLGLANLAAITDPDVFVIGGGVSKAGEILISYMEKPYREYAFFSNKDVQFVLAELGNDAGIWGAAKLIFDSWC